MFEMANVVSDILLRAHLSQRRRLPEVVIHSTFHGSFMVLIHFTAA